MPDEAAALAEADGLLQPIDWRVHDALAHTLGHPAVCRSHVYREDPSDRRVGIDGEGSRHAGRTVLLWFRGNEQCRPW
jgi:hypothetical protein